MREVHRRLRAALALAREAIEDEHEPGAPASDPLLYCWGFCAALDGHHRSEDGALFPRLVAQQPDLAPVIGRLRQDHNMIGHLIGELQRADQDGASTEEKLRHLDGIEAVMETHFRYEERKLLAVLDARVLEAGGADPAELYGPLA
jgi:hemerythrin-like domain-containing protein